MKQVLITGINGFIGRNLRQTLSHNVDLKVLGYDVDDDPKELPSLLRQSIAIFHLAGVNRPEHETDFDEVNVGLTQRICAELEKSDHRPLVVFSSSTQVEQDNPYGRSKRHAEQVLGELAERLGLPVKIYRLPGVFGKWCRPNYNSVVATFCYNLSRDIPVTVSDSDRKVELVHIDDVVLSLIGELSITPKPGLSWGSVTPVFKVTLGMLVEHFHKFRNSQKTLLVPDVSDPFIRRLFSTFQAYLPPEQLMLGLNIKSDARGDLAELLKSPSFGQLFISRTKPGSSRGYHYHNIKVEKFFVIEGDGLIRIRSMQDGTQTTFTVSGREFRVVDIPPGYTHSIENIGSTDLIVIFWASDLFDPYQTDTFPSGAPHEKN